MIRTSPGSRLSKKEASIARTRPRMPTRQHLGPCPARSQGPLPAHATSARGETKTPAHTHTSSTIEELSSPLDEEVRAVQERGTTAPKKTAEAEDSHGTLVAARFRAAMPLPRARRNGGAHGRAAQQDSRLSLSC
eukprot:scaffold1342_cov204-Pinguiococcus_pyrenoidosus.AAC.11